ncbi:hypothetical protein T4E_12072, partial [Trichinella pseudospiralis]
MVKELLLNSNGLFQLMSRKTKSRSYAFCPERQQ